MPTREFVRLTFQGGRFDGGNGMPVEALSELAAYADAIRDVARALFKERNPSRVRVSRGFADKLQLRISRIEPGSQIPVLERVRPADELDLKDQRDEYDDARDIIAECIEAVASGQPIPQRFPSASLKKFGAFGQGLETGERILVPLASNRTTTYDRSVRTEILMRTGKRYTERSTFIGHVTRLDSQRGTVDIRVSNGGPTLTATYDDYWEVLHQAQDSPPEEGRQVRIDAEAQYTADGVAERLLLIHDVTMLDTWEWADERLAELGAIERGWLGDDDGEAIDDDVFANVNLFLGELAHSGARPPHLFPTPDGGIQAQWRNGSRTTSIEFEPGDHLVMHRFDVETGEDTYDEVDNADIDTAVAFVAPTEVTPR